MKKSVLFILFAACIGCGLLTDYRLECEVGMNISNWTTDEVNAKVGFRVGVGTEYAFNDMWSLQPTLFFSTKGGKLDSGEIMGVNAKVTVNQMYLELPVMAAARFNVADNTNIVVSAGPYLAYGVGGKTKATVKYQGQKATAKMNTFGKIDKMTIEAGGQSHDIPLGDILDPSEYDLSDMKGLNRFDFGLGVGVALEYQKFIVGLDGQFGLTKLETDTGKNLNFAISVGYKFW